MIRVGPELLETPGFSGRPGTAGSRFVGPATGVHD